MRGEFILDALPSSAFDLVREADRAGAAVIVYDNDDRIVWVSDGQRTLMPCSDYADETYKSLFWKVLNAGMIGTRSAMADPAAWLEGAIAARRTSPNLDFTNIYPWGRMLVSHLRLDSGISVQARLSLKSTGICKYFGDPDIGLGVMWALRVQRHMHNMQSALNSLSIAIGLVDASGRLFNSNASFNEMLAACDGFMLTEDGDIKAIDVCDDLVLEQAVANVAEGLQPATYIPIRRSSQPPLIVAVSAGDLPGTAVLVVSRFGEDCASIASSLQQAFNMTPAEAEVAAGIGAGQSVADIAAARGVAEKTTYNQVRGVRSALRRSRFAVDDLAGIANLVTKIAAITSPGKGRKH
ncbi:hypothetical protein M2352_000460 [Azospirillum fermentarium]|uniref:helix-turn-helix transcriptional regulator n=1 Tax=Azospirillum fermentarium TaxID=1233114 RepID=UPI0022266EA6|nr:hypothetical protein [Azospirillum fermentarium]MCW2244869.1 hypothetical protein [Azospirillum fermentarium]